MSAGTLAIAFKDFITSDHVPQTRITPSRTGALVCDEDVPNPADLPQERLVYSKIKIPARRDNNSTCCLIKGAVAEAVAEAVDLGGKPAMTKVFPTNAERRFFRGVRPGNFAGVCPRNLRNYFAPICLAHVVPLPSQDQQPTSNDKIVDSASSCEGSRDTTEEPIKLYTPHMELPDAISCRLNRGMGNDSNDPNFWNDLD